MRTHTAPESGFRRGGRLPRFISWQRAEHAGSQGDKSTMPNRRVMAVVGRRPATFRNLLLVLTVYTLSLGMLASYYQGPTSEYSTISASSEAEDNILLAFRKDVDEFTSRRFHPQTTRTSLVESEALTATGGKMSIQHPPHRESTLLRRKSNYVSTSTKTTLSTSTTSKKPTTTTTKMTRTTRNARLDKANRQSAQSGAERSTQETTMRKVPSAETSAGEDFQPVHPDCQDFFVYSGHADLAFVNPTVTIVAVVNRTRYPTGTSLRCLYSNVTGETAPEIREGHDFVKGRVLILPDHHNLGFAPALIHCPLVDSHKARRPSKVSIRLDGHSSSATRQLDIHFPQPRRWKFLLCFSPLHRQFNDASLVVQNLELAQMLGAEHAVVYNTSIGADADRVLRHYVSTGFLEVRGWKDPPEPVHYKAQMAAINDCLLYGRNSSDFIVFMDFDEMIVPKHHDSWVDFIQDVQRSYNATAAAGSLKGSVVYMNEALVGALTNRRKANATKTGSGGSENPPATPSSVKVGAYAFVSSVFLWDNVSSLSAHDRSFANKLHLAFLVKQRRTAQVWPGRSKNIVNPRAVRLMGIHRVHAFVKDSATLVVNATVALLNHYRWYSPNVPTVKDISVLRFAPGLVQRVKNVLGIMH